jgi:hypothetical protein
MNVTLAITLSQQTTIAWEMCGRYEYHPTSDPCTRFNLDKEFKPCLNIALADTYRAEFRLSIGPYLAHSLCPRRQSHEWDYRSGRVEPCRSRDRKPNFQVKDNRCIPLPYAP